MSGLFGELQRTTQALTAQSQGVFTAGRNMANVNNPAYARQRVVMGDRGTEQTNLGARSLGVEALALLNVRDALLDKQVLRETSLMSALQVESDAYYKAQLALGQQIDRSDDASFIGSAVSGSSQGVGEALDNLLNSFSSLSSNPRSSAERQVVFQAAQTLISRLHTTDSRLVDLQDDITGQINTDVARVNELLGTISTLNQQIGRFEVGNPGSALDLRDQRQARLEDLSQFIDVEVESIPDSAGQIRILSRDAADNPVVLLEASKPFTAVTFDGTNFNGGSPAAVLDLRSGRLHGNLTARDGAVADLRTGLDSFAAQIVGGFNAVYNPGGAFTDFFDPAGLTAATIALDPSLTAANIRTTATTDAGANDIALAVAGLANTTFSTGAGDVVDGTFGTYYRGIVSRIANATNSAESRLDDQTTLHRLILERRDSTSGVSLDEEMTDLIKYQRAFDASARVMRVIDELLETVIHGLGA